MAKHPVPKKKTSKARRDARRSHHALTPPTLVPCPECGYYAGRKVLEV